MSVGKAVGTRYVLRAPYIFIGKIGGTTKFFALSFKDGAFIFSIKNAAVKILPVAAAFVRRIFHV